MSLVQDVKMTELTRDVNSTTSTLISGLKFQTSMLVDTTIQVAPSKIDSYMSSAVLHNQVASTATPLNVMTLKTAPRTGQSSICHLHSSQRDRVLEFPKLPMKKSSSSEDSQANSCVNATFTILVRTLCKKQSISPTSTFLLSKCQQCLTNPPVRTKLSLQIGKANVSSSMNTTADSRASRICATSRWTESEISNHYRSIEPTQH